MYELFLLFTAGYYLVYKILEYFPWDKHPTCVLGKRAYVQKIAHRGSRGEGLPENTKAAFVDAIKAGAEVLELDVWISRDGQVVVFHDPDLMRMTGGKYSGNVVDFKYSDLPELSPNEADWDQTSRQSVYPPDDCIKIPLLKDIFDAVPKETCFIIEFKQDSSQLISEVHKLIRASERYDTVLWFSLKEKVNKKLRSFDPNLPTLTSVDNMLMIVMAYYCGILPFINVRDKVFGITLDEIPLERIQSNLPGAPHWMQLCLAYLLEGVPPTILLAPTLFRHMRRRGIPVWILAVNTLEHLRLAESLGATGVLSDHPEWLQRTIVEENIQFASIDEH